MADNDSRQGKRYGNAEVVAFVDRVHAAHDEGLQAAFESPEHTGIPAIQLGASEGKLLGLLMRMVGATRVVEIGTLAGYSAARIARALPDRGHLWTIEFDPRHAEIARSNLAAAGVNDRVTVVEGAAIDVLPALEPHGPFDAVFIDADKENYDRYGAWAAANTRPGGLLIGDNAYLFGKLTAAEDRAAAMRRFHEQASRDYESVCIPTPDGMVLGMRR